MAILSGSLRYSFVDDATVVCDIWEDPTLTVKMKLSNGVLYVRGQFIEYTRSYYTQIPAPSGSVTYDLFDTYTPRSLLHGLNSGSNEWGGYSGLTAYVASDYFYGIKAYDELYEYPVNTTLSSGIKGGSGSWSGSEVYAGSVSHWGMTLDTFEYYTAGLPLSGSGSTIEPGSALWTGSWVVVLNVSRSVT